MTKETSDIIERLRLSPPGHEVRVTLRVARPILLNAPYTQKGNLMDVKNRHLGAGVYALSLVPLKSPLPRSAKE